MYTWRAVNNYYGGMNKELQLLHSDSILSL